MSPDLVFWMDVWRGVILVSISQEEVIQRVCHAVIVHLVRLSSADCPEMWQQRHRLRVQTVLGVFSDRMLPTLHRPLRLYAGTSEFE